LRSKPGKIDAKLNLQGEEAAMADQQPGGGSPQNPQTAEEARSFVRYVESLFMPWNIDALVAGFTEDCVVRFGIVPEFKGHNALRKFFAARATKQKHYRLKKEFRALMGDVMSNVWEGEWKDAATGIGMRGYGVEVWTMRSGKIAIWEAAFNVVPADSSVELTSAIA
jgi:nuclear transport factor 2 (NTF2) superfamily protein